MQYVIGLVGLVAVWHGVSIEAAAKSAMHQIYGGLYIVGGIVVVSLACLVHAVAALRRHMDALADKPPPVPTPAAPFPRPEGETYRPVMSDRKDGNWTRPY